MSKERYKLDEDEEINGKERYKLDEDEEINGKIFEKNFQDDAQKSMSEKVKETLTGVFSDKSDKELKDLMEFTGGSKALQGLRNLGMFAQEKVTEQSVLKPEDKIKNEAPKKS